MQQAFASPVIVVVCSAPSCGCCPPTLSSMLLSVMSTLRAKDEYKGQGQGMSVKPRARDIGKD